MLTAGGRAGVLAGGALGHVREVLVAPDRGQLPVAHGAVERAARCRPVGTVAEPALLGQLVEVGEPGLGLLLLLVVPRRGRPDARCVDDGAAGRQWQQFATGGGVAPVTGPADLGRLAGVDAEQDVGQGRLARARRPQQHDRATGGDRLQPVHALAGHRTGGHHLDIVQHTVELGQQPVDRFGDVDLGQGQDRHRPGLAGQHQHVPQSSGAHPGVERPGHHHHVDVGRHLLRLVPVRRPAHQQAAPGQSDQCALGVAAQPVAHDDRRAFAEPDPAGAGHVLERGPPPVHAHHPGRRARVEPGGDRLVDPRPVEAEVGQGVEVAGVGSRHHRDPRSRGTRRRRRVGFRRRRTRSRRGRAPWSTSSSPRCATG